jgi:hypothetical protein
MLLRRGRLYFDAGGGFAVYLGILPALVVLFDPDRARLESGLQVFFPQIGWFQDMPVGVDDHRIFAFGVGHR